MVTADLVYLLIFRLLIHEGITVDSSHFAKWGEYHRRPQAFPGYAEGWFVTSEWLSSVSSSPL